MLPVGEVAPTKEHQEKADRSTDESSCCLKFVLRITAKLERGDVSAILGTHQSDPKRRIQKDSPIGWGP